MRAEFRSFVFTVAGLLAFAVFPAQALPVEHNVYCHDTYCGKMTIDKYQTSSANDTATSESWLKGAEIHGTFTAAKPGEYHYIQALQHNSDSFRWTRNPTPPLPQPLIDPPMGGYKIRSSYGGGFTVDNPWDSDPWYDDASDTAPFPDFYDRPRDYVLGAKNVDSGVLSWNFETWIVCVVDVILGPNQATSADDTYIIAPLLGWLWGYTVTYVDQGIIGTDEFADFAVALNPAGIVWKDTPTALWTDALDAYYGSDVLGNGLSDTWDIQLVDCVRCQIPVADTMVLLLPPVLGVILMRRRARFSRPA